MASITSWTRLETDTRDGDLRTTVGARIFDPLWMLARQWQVAEFQAEDAGSPVVARVRATNALLTRCHPGELPANTLTHAPAYDPQALPLEVMVERRPMRPADDADPRMLRFALEAGLHFLRMLARQPLSRDYRAAFVTRFALLPSPAAPDAVPDPATRRFAATMTGRALDGRRLEAAAREGGAASVSADPTLAIEPGDRAEVTDAVARWLAWYEGAFTEPRSAEADPWIPARMEYAVSVAGRLSEKPEDERTLTAVEYDGGAIDWSSFDVNAEVNVGTEADRRFASLVETTVPAPVTFRGAPAGRFWELEDARIEYGLLPVGPTDLAHLLMIEYASSYGNDWFVVPLTLPVGSLTTIDSLVVTDTFGVRSLLRPIGDRALPRAHWSMWQQAFTRGTIPGPHANLFFLPPSLAGTLEGNAVEEVLFMRDEMANVAWAIERRIETPIETVIPRTEDPRPAATGDTGEPTGAANAPPRYLLASTVPAHWIPLLPVQIPLGSGAGESRLRRGAVLQPDGSKIVNTAQGEVLHSAREVLLYDEEIPREGIRIERRRQMARWLDGSTWVWTAYRKQVGRGEGSSGLRFDSLETPPS